VNRRDLVILLVLVALWLSWPMIYRRFIGPLVGESTAPAKPPVTAAEESREPPALGPEHSAEAAGKAAGATAEAASEAAASEIVEKPLPEGRTATIENDFVGVSVSTRGGGIVAVVLKRYPSSLEPDSGPVVLDFSRVPALVYEGLPGASVTDEFAMAVSAGGRGVDLRRELPGGVVLKRRLRLGDDYLIQVRDVFVNSGREESGLPACRWQLGAMPRIPAASGGRRYVYLGVDTLFPGGEPVRHWGRKLAGYFKRAARADASGKLPVTIRLCPRRNPIDWIAVKNKYFTQILTPSGGGDGWQLYARRETDPRESDPAYRPRMTQLAAVAAWVEFEACRVPAGESLQREARYYVGPKKYSELAVQGFHQVDIMEFGMWAPVGRILLKTLNFIHDHVWPHNYGLAIMLLTVIIRIIFWPVTHKSTESMRRMQEIQPLISEIREKYKDNTQKQQQELMAVYREHKVNPLGGCLPMLIQIPVFIALFVVLRSAIELRFASFLWIRDLSEPEGLLAGVLPIPLNILPVIMAVTMYWQQKLTPSGGDSQQQKMMAFMPLMMLVLFYNFASGLVLYWTTNQCLMIVQQLHMRRKRTAEPSASRGKRTRSERR